MMKIYILRHGETTLNSKGVMQGWLDEPLNENGRKLAVLSGQAINIGKMVRKRHHDAEIKRRTCRYRSVK